MRSSNPAMVAARATHNLKSRDFVRIAGRDRLDNSIHWLNVWNGIGTVSAEVLDIDTGLASTVSFLGDGALISVDPIVYICEQQITDRTIAVALSKIDSRVDDFVRTYDLHEQAVLIFQGDFTLGTETLVSPAECVWAGVVDTNQITRAAAGNDSATVINVRSAMTEMTRTNTLKRSHASEVLRNAADTFYQDTATVGDWLTYLGQATPAQIKKVI